MKVLYVSPVPSDDRKSWSGTYWYMRHALESAGVEVDLYDNFPFERPLWRKLQARYYGYFEKGSYDLHFEPDSLKKAARQIKARYKESGCEAIFFPGGGIPLQAFMDADLPVFTYLDVPKQLYVENYFGMDSLCDRSQRHVRMVDQVSFKNNRLSIFGSDWAARYAIDKQGAAPDRVAVVPFGANLEYPPTGEEVRQFIAARSATECRLAFIGKEWERKGGDTALALTAQLRSQGIPALLQIVGCTPRLTQEQASYARVYGFIDRSNSSGRQQFDQILSNSHFLLFFSTCEAYGLALCEACAYGVPAIGSAVGGIPSILNDKINGLLLPNPIDIVKACQWIVQKLESPDAYTELAFSTRASFEERLNWNTSGRRLRVLLEKHLQPMENPQYQLG